MKKIMIVAALATASAPSGADTLLGLYAGAGQWYVNLEGDVGQNGSTTTLDDLGFKNENSNVFWLMFEHPIPIIPNLRFMHSGISAREQSTTSQRFTIGGIVIDAEVDVLTDMDLSHTDATFYYEVLDNWLTLDLGVTARHMEGYVEVQTEVTQTARSDLKGVLPMAYLNLQFDLPFSGWHIGATGNTVSYRGDNVSDFAGRIGYEFPVTPLLDIGINLGYRSLTIKAEEFDDLYADAELSGAFAELQIHF